MRIINRPPKLQWIVKAFFPGYDFSKVIFAFGDTIYAAKPLASYNLVHEKVHLRQMKYSKLYGIIHFIRFVLSKKFRYQSELEAYQEEYKYIKKIAPQAADKCARGFAKILAGESENSYVYGKVADSYDSALWDILNNAKRI